MATKIGLSGAEVTVPDPTDDPEYVEGYELLAGSQRALDGTLQTCYRTAKRHWRVTWMILTTAQKDTLLTELVRTSDLSWMPPSGGTYTVHVVPSPEVSATPIGWTVKTELVEV